MVSRLKRLLLHPLFLAIGSVIVVLVFLVGRADGALFGPPPRLWASVSYVPLLGHGTLNRQLLARDGSGAPVLLKALDYPAAYVIRVRNRAEVTVDDVHLAVRDADFAYREGQGAADLLQGTNGRFRVGAVAPGEQAVLWVFGRTLSEQVRSSGVRVYSGSSTVPLALYELFLSGTLSVVLHLSQIVIGLIVVEGLAIAGTFQLLRRLLG